MYTIVYASGCRVWEVPKHKLTEYIVTSTQDILDVYEQATPVTKRVQKELAEAYDKGQLRSATAAARRFMFPPTTQGTSRQTSTATDYQRIASETAGADLNQIHAQ